VNNKAIVQAVQSTMDAFLDGIHHNFPTLRILGRDARGLIVGLGLEVWLLKADFMVQHIQEAATAAGDDGEWGEKLVETLLAVANGELLSPPDWLQRLSPAAPPPSAVQELIKEATQTLLAGLSQLTPEGKLVQNPDAGRVEFRCPKFTLNVTKMIQEIIYLDSDDPIRGIDWDVFSCSTRRQEKIKGAVNLRLQVAHILATTENIDEMKQKLAKLAREQHVARLKMSAINPETGAMEDSLLIVGGTRADD